MEILYPGFRYNEYGGVLVGAEIAYIEDERDLADFVRYFLEKEGYQVLHFSSGEEFLRTMEHLSPQLILLDLMLPGIGGFEVFHYIKSHPRFKHVPVIMLTVKNDPMDIVSGLEMGADDYVTKPFHPRELLARIRAVLRRTGTSSFGGGVLQVGDMVLLPENLTVEIGGEVIPLSFREFRLLELLVRNRGRIVTRQMILDEVWGEDAFVTDRVVDVYIAHLRKKLGPRGQWIVTVRGVGYSFEPS